MSKYDFRKDEKSYLPIIQLRILEILTQTFNQFVCLDSDLVATIKGVDNDLLISIIETELGFEFEDEVKRPIRTPNDIIELIGDVMSEDEIRIYHKTLLILNLKRKQSEMAEYGVSDENIDDEIERLEMELMIESNEENKAIYQLFEDRLNPNNSSPDNNDEEWYQEFQAVINKLAETLSIQDIITLWNEGIDSSTIDSDDQYVYLEVLKFKGAIVTEVEKCDAVEKRLKIKYDYENNAILCLE